MISQDLELKGSPGKTQRVVVKDTARLLVDDLAPRAAALAELGVVAMVITVEDYSVRIGWGGAVPSATHGHVLAPGQSLFPVGEMATTLRYINAEAGSPAVMHVTPILL